MAHRRGAIRTRSRARGGGHHRAGEGDCASTDARLTHRAIEKLVEMANARASSYARVICAWQTRGVLVGRYTHATSSSALGGNSNSCARSWR